MPQPDRDGRPPRVWSLREVITFLQDQFLIMATGWSKTAGLLPGPFSSNLATQAIDPDQRPNASLHSPNFDVR